MHRGIVLAILLTVGFVPACGAIASAQPAPSSSNDSLLPQDVLTATIEPDDKVPRRADLEFDGVKTRVSIPPLTKGVPGLSVSIAGKLDRTATSFDEEITLTFSKDADLGSYPSFRLEIPQGVNPDQPFQLNFYDGSSDVALRRTAVAPAEALDYSNKLTFVGGFFTPFHARAGVAYVARLALPKPVAEVAADAAQTVTLAPAAGHPGFVYSDVEGNYSKATPATFPATPDVTATLDLPALQLVGSPLLIATSAAQTAVLPPLSAPTLTALPYDVTFTVRGKAVFAGDATATLTLPLTAEFSARNFNLALWDATQKVWRTNFVATSSRQGDILRLKIGRAALDRLGQPGTHLLRLYALQPKKARLPLIAIVGDSINVLTILPQGLNQDGTCVSTFLDGGCEYTVDFALSYPGVVGQIAQVRVINFGRLDTKPMVGGVNSAEDTQVPFIPPETDVVVLEGGRADTMFSNGTNSGPHAADITDAILARAPHAKIVYFGPSCEGSDPQGWFTAERALAPHYGIFFDPNDLPSCGDTVLHPDGLHASPQGNRVIGQAIANAVETVLASGFKVSSPLPRGVTARAVLNLPVPPPTNAAVINPSAASPQRADLSLGGVRASVVVPRLAVAVSGLTIDVRGKIDRAATPLDGVITLTFNKDADFDGYPTFRLEMPPGVDPDQAFQLNFYDGASHVALRKIGVAPEQTADYRNQLSFMGGFFTPFHARAGTIYTARLALPAKVTNVVSSTAPQTVSLAPGGGVPGFVFSDGGSDAAPAPVSLPAAPDVTAALDLPPIELPGSSLKITAGGDPPAGVAPLSGTVLNALPYLVTFDVRGTVRFAGDATLTLTLPLTHQFAASEFNLAAWDPAEKIWKTGIAATASREGDVLRLKIDQSVLRRFGRTGSYTLGAYGVGTETSPTAGPLIAVLGDAIDVLTILPQGFGVDGGCNAEFSGDGACEYTADQTLSFPGVVAQLTGGRVLNFGRLYQDPSTIAQVALIPPDTDVVVLEGGRTEIVNSATPDSGKQAAGIAAAIAARAPHAKIVFVGPNCAGTDPQGWWTAEEALAPRYGTFVDPTTLPQCGSYLRPDGIEASPEGNRVIGAAIAKAVESVLSPDREK